MSMQLSLSSFAAKPRPLASVLFLKDVPEIARVGGGRLGPFCKMDVATLPEVNARALIAQGAALAVEGVRP